MWPNEIPIEGHPEDINNRFNAYQTWLLETDLPKLFFWATPGRLVTLEKARWYLDHLKNIKGVFVGKSNHFFTKRSSASHRLRDVFMARDYHSIV